MKKFLLVVVALCIASSAFAQKAHVLKAFNKNQVPPPISAQIYYGGGPVMSNPINVYVIYYGYWPKKSRGIVNQFVSHLGGSALFNTNTTYWQNSGANVGNVVNYNPATNSTIDLYSLGRNISDTDVQTIISNVIAAGTFPADEDGVYFVLTASDVNETALGVGFCTYFCGYHYDSTSIVTGDIIKYSFVGNPARCPSSCDGSIGLYGDATSPNGDVGGDGTVNIMYHELSEAASDPEFDLAPAWGGGVTGENGDMCAWFFGGTKLASNGSHYNLTLGPSNYLIQQMLKLTGTGVDPFYDGTCVRGLKVQ